ncbi:TonB-dependent receptor [Ponticaulis profundi]|uniref:TonB-dependent receptor n=1 Tax=Ponticaulis profundi TaxID=2665222 RepID=A0ABW1S6A0_9PROT
MKTNNTFERNASKLRTLLLCGSAFTAATLAGISAFAQETETEAADADRRLQIVTVTATKKEQTLQETPVAVSVIDDSVIDQAEILDLQDLQTLVPSLKVDQYQTSANTSFFIRGFGNGANNAGVEPSVGVFIDGVYRSRSAAQVGDLPNLQRVEVLRGPQSTLFGKNASAGVISIITAEPAFEQSGSIEGSLGNDNLMRASGDITGPITDKIAYSLAANINKRDGYADDLGTGEDMNDRNRWGVRGQLLFLPTDDLKIRVIADYNEIDETCCVAANITNGPTGAAIFALGGALDPEDPFSYEIYSNYAPTNEIENYGVSAQIDYDFNGMTLTSITSARGLDYLQNADADFTSADLIGTYFNDTSIETFTQELRLAGSHEDAFDWMIGGFYFDETVEIENEIYYGTDLRGYADILSGGGYAQVEALLGLPVGTTFGQPGQGLVESYGQDNQSWSVFATVDAYVTDRLTATVGFNYTEDEKDAFAQVANSDPFSALDFVSIGNSVLYQTAVAQTLAGYGIDATDPAQLAAFAMANPAALAQIQSGAQAFADANDDNAAVNPLLGLQALQFFPPFVNYPNAVESGSSDDEKLTYAFRVTYEMSDNFDVYGSIATGFKATSWNLSRDSRPFAGDIPSLFAQGLGVTNLSAGTRYAGPEEATVYEVGMKAAFDNLAFNIAIFDQEIKGFQSNVFLGTGYALSNAGIQSTKGIEADVTWSPMDGLTLFAAGTFLDPLYDEFENSGAGDISGQTPAGISETALSLAASYDFTLPNGWDAFVRGDWQYESPTALTDDPDEVILLKGLEREVSVFNAAAGFDVGNGVDVSIWGRNIFNDEYIAEAFPAVAQAGSMTGYPNAPRAFGITVGYEF